MRSSLLTRLLRLRRSRLPQPSRWPLAAAARSHRGRDVPDRAGIGAGAPEPLEGKPVQGGTIVYGTDREPTCLDPHNLGDMPQTYVARQFLDSLVSMQPDGTVVPWLADSWEISKDGLQYTFHLKKDVKFTDGDAVQRRGRESELRADARPGNAVLDQPRLPDADLQGDRRRRRVHGADQPQTAVLALPRSTLARPSSGWSRRKRWRAGLEDNCVSPVGTGPFIMKKWTKGQSVELVRNPDYNSPPADANNQGPAYLDADHLALPAPTPRCATRPWRAARRTSSSTSRRSSMAAAESDPKMEVQEFIHAGLGHYIILDNSEPPFDDLEGPAGLHARRQTPRQRSKAPT